MAWYRTGTVSVTNGSTTVTGSGTNFVAGAQVGEGFAAPDGRLYEIVSIVSATSLTIGKAYLGSTQTGQSYEIVPTQSLVADLASQVSTLISDFQDVADLAGEGKFDYGTAASPGITFTLDQDTGFFHDTNNEIGVAAGGTKVAEFNSGGLTFASGKGVVGDADLGGNITLSRTNGSSIKRATDTDFLSLLSGTTTALGANIVMYGGSNVSLPNWNIIKGDNIQFQPVDGVPVYLNLTDASGAIFNESGADLDFRIESDTNAYAFFLQGSDGYIGIGDSAPPTILSVRGETPESRITNTNTISDTGGTEEVARLGVYGQKNNVYGPAANIVFRQDATTWSSAETYQKGTRIEFCTQDSTATDTSETPRMVIDRDGLVGIGTDNPAANLEIDAGYATGTQLQITTTGFGHNFDMVDGRSTARIRNTDGSLRLSADNNDEQAASEIVFLVDGSEKMSIDASGTLLSPGGAAFVGTVATGSTNGAIIERGSNANGEYVKFADGTMICTQAIGSVDINISAGNVYRSNSINADFPATFDSVPVGSGSIGNTVTAWANGRTGSTTQWSFSAFSYTSRTGDTVKLTAIGRWF